MKRTLTVLAVLFASAAFASDLEVPLGARAPIKSKKAIHEVVVREPSMLKVVVTGDAVSLEGTQSGVTGITVEYADGELERLLVVVGDGQSSGGMTAEQPKTIDLKQTVKAQAAKKNVRAALETL